MNPARKRKIRLIVALTAAVLLATALIYTSFSAATEATTPSKLLKGAPSERTVELTGKVAAGSVKKAGDTLYFSIRDRSGTGPAVPVVYTGVVPDPFRVGREVIVTGKMQGGTFVGERDSLITKCPSKFQAEPGSSKGSSKT